MSTEMDIDSPTYNHSSEAINTGELMESPLFHAKSNQQSKSKQLPLRPVTHHRSNSLKRPLTMSPKVDSPTCSVLAADFSTNFHVNNNNFKINNPKKILLPSMISDENDTMNKENQSANKGIFSFSMDLNSTNNKKPIFYRKHLRKTSSSTSFKSNSLSSSLYHHRSSSSSSVMFNQQHQNSSLTTSFGSSIFHSRSKSSIATPDDFAPSSPQTLAFSRAKLERGLRNDSEHPNILQQQQQQLTPNSKFKILDLDSLCIPTPISERIANKTDSDISPETQSVIAKSSLKKSFSLMNPQHSSFECSSSSSASSASENEEEDSDNDSHNNHTITTNTNNYSDDIASHLTQDLTDDEEDDSENSINVGSPLQQRVTSRSRIELNSNLKSKIQRARSMIQSHTELSRSLTTTSVPISKFSGQMAKPQLFKLSTSNMTANASASYLSAGTSQLANNINGLSFSSHNNDDIQTLSYSNDEFSNNSVLKNTSIKTFKVDDCTIPRIDVDQFHDILVNFKKQDKTANKFSKHFDELVVIDCRFEYEFKGGHIDYALNASSKQELEELLLSDSVIQKTPLDHTETSRKLIIFHCEFSSHRGPLMANSLRAWDRYLNKEYYPNLYYPDIVVLEGGYKKFYEKFGGVHCYPLDYIEMEDPKFKDECEVQLDKLRRDSKMNLNRKNSSGSSFSSANSSANDLSNITPNTSQMSLKKGSSSTSVLNFSASTKMSLKKSNTISTLKNTSFLFTSADIEQCPGGRNHDSLALSCFPNSLAHDNDINGGLGGLSSGALGGFGSSSVDLDNLCDDSPIFSRTFNLTDSSETSRSTSSTTGLDSGNATTITNTATSSTSRATTDTTTITTLRTLSSSRSIDFCQSSNTNNSRFQSQGPTVIQLPSSQKALDQSSPSISSNIFKLPSLPHRKGLHFRSKTISSFHDYSDSNRKQQQQQHHSQGNVEITTPPHHLPHILKSSQHHLHEMHSKFTKPFEKHIDTPISKK